MTIQELLAAFDSNEIQLNFFHEGDIEAMATKDGTRIAFYTGSITPHDLLNNAGPVGVVLWLPRKKFQKLVG